MVLEEQDFLFCGDNVMYFIFIYEVRNLEMFDMCLKFPRSSLGTQLSKQMSVPNP